MESIAFLSLNRHRFGRLNNVSLIATGLKQSFYQSQAIHGAFPNRKIAMVFGNDLFGSLADILIAAGIPGIPVTFAMEPGEAIVVDFRTPKYSIPRHKVSLSYFERSVKKHFHMRTFKFRKANSYLELLLSNPYIEVKVLLSFF
jgi:hypothetical protein